MSHPLQFIWSVLLPLLGLAFGVWLLGYSWKRSEEPNKLVFKWLLTLALACPIAWGVARLFKLGFAAGGLGGAAVAIGGLFLTVAGGCAMYAIWRHSLIDVVTSPITSLYDGGNEPPEPKPLYSIALAKRKFNRPLEAIVLIREQLAKFPNDFEGVMLLATIQAEDLNDLPGAEITLNHFCAAPQAPDRQVVAAWPIGI